MGSGGGGGGGSSGRGDVQSIALVPVNPPLPKVVHGGSIAPGRYGSNSSFFSIVVETVFSSLGFMRPQEGVDNCEPSVHGRLFIQILWFFTCWVVLTCLFQYALFNSLPHGGHNTRTDDTGIGPSYIPLIPGPVFVSCVHDCSPPPFNCWNMEDDMA